MTVGIGHHQQALKVLQDYFGDKEITGVEIGTAAGDLTWTLLKHMPTLKRIHTIDPWKYSEENVWRKWYPQSGLDKAKERAYFILSTYGDRVVIHDVTSDDAVDKITGPVNFVWIDGDHSLEQVKKDIDNYMPKIEKGGILGGHDYQLLVKSLPEWLSYPINTGDDLTWWVYL